MKALIVSTAVVLSLALAAPAEAGLGSRAAGELAEFVMKKFGKEAVQEGAEKLAGRIVQAAARHGDDVVKAIRKVGPKAITLADDAGANAPRVLRLLNHYGDDAVRALSRPRGMVLVSRYGDDAAEALIRHKGVAEPLLENLGAPAVKAMNALGPQSGRRLAMMAGGDLAAIGRTPELLDVVARYGDKAMDFIWRNKAVLASGAALATFLRDPEPLLNGAADLTQAVSENVVRPVAQAAAAAIEPVAEAAVASVGPMVQTAAGTMKPAVVAAADAARTLAVWMGGGLLAAIVVISLVARLVAKSGFLGKLVVRTGLRLAGDSIVTAVKKK